ncbi:hypothetical protein VQH23_19515 [Pararoseomonas sp. SCSIO 73927]|uniref:hypothetical protein n=1 Tax=Pararoseomonas sp. SCSIO 73927 TaxID=3114537 RepID=UPI0030CF33B2
MSRMGLCRQGAGRAAVLLLLLALARSGLTAEGPARDTAAVVDGVLASGDGRGRETAYTVDGLLWTYAVLDRLGLNLVRQRSMPEGDGSVEIVTAMDRATRGTREVVFRVRPRPDRPAAEAETDRIVRAVVTSGDGASPETAFVVGGRIGAEYALLRYMGLRSRLQALVRIRGCSFDVQHAREAGRDEDRQVYFKLGRDALDPEGPCALQPEAR